MTEFMLAHPILSLIGWCWAWFCFWMGLAAAGEIAERKEIDNERTE